MAGAEAIQGGWQNPSDANEATELLKQLEKFGERLLPIQRSIEYANDQASVFASSSVIVSHALLAKLEDLNTRYAQALNAWNASSRFKFISLIRLTVSNLKRNFALFPGSYYIYAYNLKELGKYIIHLFNKNMVY